MTEQHLNVLSFSEVNLLLDFYRNRNYSIDENMNIFAIGDNDVIKNLIDKKVTPLIDSSYEIMWECSHFYSHEYPYFLHTDYQPYWKEAINVVIPLFNESPSSLLIFDQRWRQWPVTWFFDYDLIYITTNPAIKGAPHNYPIENMTGNPIDDDFYKKYLLGSWGSKDDYFGLSGNAYDHESGSAIIFDSSKIHGTSKMMGNKIGLTVRYKIKQ